MKLLILTILLSAPTFTAPTAEAVNTQEVAALPDYNTYRIRKMRALFEIRTSPKLFMIKIA